MSISNYTGEKEDSGLPNDTLLSLTGGSDVRKPRNLAFQVPQESPTPKTKLYDDACVKEETQVQSGRLTILGFFSLMLLQVEE